VSDSFTPEERRILDARARAAAAPVRTDVEAREHELIVIRSGTDLYGLRGREVRAVAALTRLSPLPQSPPHVAGLTVFRGGVLVVFHLHALLGAAPTLSEHGRMIVLDDDCALAVDAVERLEALGELRPAPEGLERAAGWVQGVTSSGVAVLDIDRLRSSDSLLVDIPRTHIASSGNNS
jgi:chemotaxis signal transduction protein